ncbi:uncharacterized protein PFL1_00283 [Pseudozyma flocculosa PF-1]|uniref:Uncharacterized protein n=1 Tax=Pseudozyma flocculosa TaxID=84751 RepID=A0A5C3ETI9_9BASI|nr:uncharacterized protein PFL1_00283 [Pseudozyma flocculosa PF-1]EPQ32085.1 hypothetical protein PFL1_00283 [Pseudozyma flocculosa PF-1]SPO34985.1 uncharacterized protein PSFLO_00456 [Pseudozyma flocculosa]
MPARSSGRVDPLLGPKQSSSGLSWCRVAIHSADYWLLGTLSSRPDNLAPTDRAWSRFDEALYDDAGALFLRPPPHKRPDQNPRDPDTPLEQRRRTDCKLSTMAAIAIAEQLNPELSTATSEQASQLERQVASLAPHLEKAVARHLFVRVFVKSFPLAECFSSSDVTLERRNAERRLPSLVCSFARHMCDRAPHLYADLFFDFVTELWSIFSPPFENLELGPSERGCVRGLRAAILLENSRENSWPLTKALYVLDDLADCLEDDITRQVVSSCSQPANPVYSSLLCSEKILEARILREAVQRLWRRSLERAYRTPRHLEVFKIELQTCWGEVEAYVLSRFQIRLLDTRQNCEKLRDPSCREEVIAKWEAESRDCFSQGGCSSYSRPMSLFDGDTKLEAFAETATKNALELWKSTEKDIGEAASSTRLMISRLAMDAGAFSLTADAIKAFEIQGSSFHEFARAYLYKCEPGRRHLGDVQSLTQSELGMALEKTRVFMNKHLVERLRALQRHVLRATRSERQAELAHTVPLHFDTDDPDDPMPFEHGFTPLSLINLAIALHAAGLYVVEAMVIEAALQSPSRVEEDRWRLDLTQADLRHGLLKANRRAESLAVAELQRANSEADAGAKRGKPIENEDGDLNETSATASREPPGGADSSQAGQTPAAKTKAAGEWKYDEALDTWVLTTPATATAMQPGSSAAALTSREAPVNGTPLRKVGGRPSTTTDDDVLPLVHDDEDQDEGEVLDDSMGSDASSDDQASPTFDLTRSLRKPGRKVAAAPRAGPSQRGRPPTQPLFPRGNSLPSSPVTARGRRTRSQVSDSDDASDDELDLFQARTPPPRRQPKPVQRYDGGKENTLTAAGTSQSGDSGRGGIAGAWRMFRPLDRMRKLDRSLSLGQMPLSGMAGYLFGDRGNRSSARSSNARGSASVSGQPGREQGRSGEAGATTDPEATGPAVRTPPRRARARRDDQAMSEPEGDDDFQPDDDDSDANRDDDDDDDDSDRGRGDDDDDDGAAATKAYNLRSRPSGGHERDVLPGPSIKRRKVASDGVEVVVPAPASGSGSRSGPSRRWPVLDL